MISDSIVTVTKVKRLRNSANGNPRYRLTLDSGGRLTTATDAGFVYGLPSDLTGEWVITVNGRGTISDMRRPEGGEYLTACEWYAMCANTTSKATTHPIVGPTPICDRCATKHGITPEFKITGAYNVEPI